MAVFPKPACYLMALTFNFLFVTTQSPPLTPTQGGEKKQKKRIYRGTQRVPACNTPRRAPRGYPAPTTPASFLYIGLVCSYFSFKKGFMPPTEMQLYDEKYFAAQISKSDRKAAWQYGRLLRYGRVAATSHPRLLDAGCGAGPALPFLQSEGFRLTASDFIFFPLLEARKRAPEVPLLNFDLGQGLPFQPATFDVILASEVIEHLTDPALFLAESYRVLAPGGVLLLTTPNLWDIRRGWAVLTGGQWSGYRDPTHINLMDPRRLKRLLLEAGFNSIRLKTGIKPAFSRSIRRFGWRFEVSYPPLIGNGIMVAAYK